MRSTGTRQGSIESADESCEEERAPVEAEVAEREWFSDRVGGVLSLAGCLFFEIKTISQLVRNHRR
jgi:hypothetical protein